MSSEKCQFSQTFSLFFFIVVTLKQRCMNAVYRIRCKLWNKVLFWKRLALFVTMNNDLSEGTMALRVEFGSKISASQLRRSFQ